MTNEELIRAVQDRADSFTKEQVSDLAEFTANLMREKHLGEHSDESIIWGMLDGLVTKALERAPAESLNRIKQEVSRL